MLLSLLVILQMMRELVQGLLMMEENHCRLVINYCNPTIPEQQYLACYVDKEHHPMVIIYCSYSGLYQFILQPMLSHYIPSLLKRVGAGVFISLVNTLYYTLPWTLSDISYDNTT